MMIRQLVIFGASGDLTTRYLLPAIISLVEVERAPDDLSILALSRKDWNTTEFRDHAKEKIENLDKNFSHESMNQVISRIQYKQISDPGDHSQLQHALGSLMDPIIFYLALPPSVFTSIIQALGQLQLHDESRVIIEKPFGQDLETAQTLNGILEKTFPEKNVFLIDHFLGKQTVKNILGFRFANRLFEPSWKNHHIERVEIIWDETLALEGRASYYDSSGALKI